MDVLKFQKTENKFKPLNATNGGPWYKRPLSEKSKGNFYEYKAARIPYSRNHDANICGETYGGPYVHDVYAIFRNFESDVNDPASYEFVCTDEDILATLDAGTETFYRLGHSIEHQKKKYGTVPPKDFQKYAEICEHIIRHYNEGWADGFELNIKYWEIWNEPDGADDDSPNKCTWGGSKPLFFEFYAIVAKHLKKCFPDIKVGGPAIRGKEDWAKDFLKEMKRQDVPIDFFSWHTYCITPEKMMQKAQIIKKMLIETGYENAESILNEWNYVKDWGVDFVKSVKTIIGMKGAAFTMSCITEAQKSDGIDMLMYYDTRPSVFCGAFDYYTDEPLKGYYPLYWYGKFYDMKSELRCVNQPENIYTLCGEDENGKKLCILTSYSDDDDAPDKNIKLDLGNGGEYEIYLLDNEHDGELIGTSDDLDFNIKNQSCILIKEV